VVTGTFRARCASFVGLLVFLGMYPIGWLSYNFIEKPALRFRTRYVIPKAEAVQPALMSQQSR
jgi:peptidoglycan/LPS O-acetylase OafA/YrhL